MKTLKTAVMTLALTVGLIAQAGAQDEQPDMNELMKAMGALMSGGGQEAAPVVDFRELRALLPASLEGMKRTNASGEKTGAMGMTVSFAEGTYEAEDGGRVTIKISDNGGMGGFMALAQAGWSMSEIDRESDTGFERTTTYNGNKAHEQYDSQDRYGSAEMLVGQRFMIEIEGSDVEWKAIESAMKKIDAAKLATLKPVQK
jgi:hypothetical protein